MKNQLTKYESNPEEESLLLNKISRSHVFQTPEHYFEKLPVVVAERIHQGEKATPAPGWKPVRVLTLAGFAVLAIIAGVTYFTSIKTEKSVDPVLSYEEVENSGVMAELDETMLFEELDSRTPIETDASTVSDAEENELLKEYLIESNTDITLIINEL